MEKNSENKTEKNSEKEPVCLYTEDSDFYSEDEYRSCCGIDENDEIDQNSYWEWVNDCQHAQLEDFTAHCDNRFAYDRIVITGCLGLWDGNHRIVPEYVKEDERHSAFINAILKCNNIGGQSTCSVYLNNDGTVKCEVSHHDGMSVFTILRLDESSEPLMDYIDMYGEDDDHKASDLVYKKFDMCEFEY